MLKRALAFSRMRHLIARQKNELSIVQTASARKRQSACTIVRHTARHSTPRTERYNSTAASASESAKDQRLRFLSPSGASSSALMRLLLFHEVVAHHMHHDHVQVFDAAGVFVAHLNIYAAARAEQAAIAARKRDGGAADRI